MDLHRIVTSQPPALQIERLREEGSRQLEKQQRLIQEQIRQEREQRLRGESPSPPPTSHSGEALCGVSVETSTCWDPLPPAGILGHPTRTHATCSFLLPVRRGLFAFHSARGLLAGMSQPQVVLALFWSRSPGERPGILCLSRTVWSVSLHPAPRCSQPCVGRTPAVPFSRQLGRVPLGQRAAPGGGVESPLPSPPGASAGQLLPLVRSDLS